MKNLEKFVESLKENLGDNLVTVFAFGSMANVDDAKIATGTTGKSADE